ncbi:MAG: hypothetical protein A2653_03360 [Candidatus Zambryskibacteria bacterium RIFCSPHIGHO2_01_FULL_43_25]|uniref:Nudix hydrolase domain-containing protein n=1 Tax=Candidatus Zambryskibacteria bacterium RIFCSPLOWO2_01_FULL_45_21 TaxID=1802761 RepID=A0A1G2U202_9BACT|nr:MAG: hypothetical protein A2653_03360 [Candidatus Zambryskibacteria bacterium RIFCSPHIGHO2_01_FULL_43_25]OHB00174.1 MAG: hypothetical protein A3E94_01150 [Candidatus Zambryskibacteria bacterium RIFCSPHIGHO2_12_FULL_44_12b]OHB03439.1 MAG: hypothetical protein A3B14_02830 [Candidatus Zambryskibacteria bacterium RIFCSPLOWO2_01_FULL_45_21]
MKKVLKVAYWFLKKIGKVSGKKSVLFKTDYMSAWRWTASNGDLYTAVKTAPAVVVLPYFKEQDSHYVVLIEQVRPENDNRKTLKTVGGYIGEKETPVQAVVRNLENKLGIKVESNRIISDGRMLGYTVVEIPVNIFRIELNYDEIKKITDFNNDTITTRIVSLKQALDLAKTNNLGDDSTAVPIYRFYWDHYRL